MLNETQGSQRQERALAPLPPGVRPLAPGLAPLSLGLARLASDPERLALGLLAVPLGPESPVLGLVRPPLDVAGFMHDAAWEVLDLAGPVLDLEWQALAAVSLTREPVGWLQGLAQRQRELGAQFPDTLRDPPRPDRSHRRPMVLSPAHFAGGTASPRTGWDTRVSRSVGKPAQRAQR